MTLRKLHISYPILETCSDVRVFLPTGLRLV